MHENDFRPPAGAAIPRIATSIDVRLLIAAQLALQKPRVYFLVKTKCFSMFVPTSSRCLQYALKPPL